MKTFLIITSIIFVSLAYLLNRDLVNANRDKVILQHQVDSLRSELSVSKIDLGRYETAYDMFMEEYKECGKKYDKIISRLE